MSDARPDLRSVKSVFDQVWDLPESERQTALDRLCGTDAALRSEVESLLAHDRLASTNFLGGYESPDETQPPERIEIDRFEIQAKIGEGGFGVVYRAHQLEPVRRIVALKVLKHAGISTDVLARFENERQSLASMSHPSIAGVFDAGVTRRGAPFIAMELVEGSPITSYCDAHRCTIEQRLHLFVQVCAALEHAHRRGVIHRDIKPSNVLVIEQADSPLPKVIDFGIAKAIEPGGAAASAHTIEGQLIGTPQYMSPEQAAGVPRGIDTRTDVYSLGVLLYELLCGMTPLDVETLRSSGSLKLMQVIATHERTAPSRRLARAADMPGIAHARSSTPEYIRRRLKGDLDRIVLKALELDPDRRYPSPGALAEDIRRHLAHMPVSAVPPSTAYRLSKLYQRRRVGFIAATLVILAVVLGATGTVIFAFRAVAAEAESRAQAERAESELARANAIKMFLAGMLTSITPEVAQGMDTALLRGVLDDAARRLRSNEIGDRAIAADLSTTVANAYEGLGLPEAGRHFAEEALRGFTELHGENHPDTISAMMALARIELALARKDDARRLFARASEAAEAVFGPDDPRTLAPILRLRRLRAESSQSEEHIESLAEVIERYRRRLGAEAPDTLFAELDYAEALIHRGRPEDAAPIITRASARLASVLGPDHPRTILAATDRGYLLLQLGRYEEAEPVLRDAIERTRRVFGSSHPLTINAMGDLAYLLRVSGRAEEAIELYRREVAIELERFGPNNSRTIISRQNLGAALRAAGRHAESVEVLTLAFDSARESLGDEDRVTQGVRSSLAAGLWMQGDRETATGMFRDLLEVNRRLHGPDASDTLIAEYNLASCLLESGQPVQARALFQHVYATRANELPADHPRLIDTALLLARAQLEAGDPGAALTLMRRVEPAARSRWAGPGDPGLLPFLSQLAGALRADGRLLEAVAALEEAFARVTASGQDPESAEGIASELAAILEALHEAEPQAGHLERARNYRPAARPSP